MSSLEEENANWGAVIEQGLVIFNAGVNATALTNTRLKNTESLPPDQRLGGVGPQTGKFARSLWLQRMQPAFTMSHTYFPKTDTSTTHGIVFNDKKLPVFTSFAGFSTVEAQGSQEKLHKMVNFVGFCMDTYRTNDPSQTKSGMAIAIAGSCTTYWTGPGLVYPGDTVMWRLPSIDPKIREEETAAMRLPDALKDGTVHPILEAWSPNAIQDFKYDAIEMMFDARYIEQMEIRNISGNYGELDSTEFVALAFKQATLMAGLSTVMALNAYGLIDIKVPDSGDPIAQAAYSKNSAILSKPFREIMRHKVSSDANGNITALPLTELSSNQRLEESKKRANNLLFLASVLGAHPALGQFQHLKPKYQVMQAALGGFWHDHIRNNQQAAEFRLDQVFRDDRTFIGSRYGDIRTFNLKTLEGQIANASADAPVNFLQSASQLFYQCNRQYAFIALTASKPGLHVDWAR